MNDFKRFSDNPDKTGTEMVKRKMMETVMTGMQTYFSLRKKYVMASIMTAMEPSMTILPMLKIGI